MPQRESRKAEAQRLQSRLAEIQADLARLERERAATRARLEAIRLELAACPKCGRDHDFLTDAGGFLAHVLEDAADVELLTPGKPLFCPACGDVFLYAGPTQAAAPIPVKRSALLQSA